MMLRLRVPTTALLAFALAVASGCGISRAPAPKPVFDPTLYVSTRGDDTGPGTRAQPLRSISEAAARARRGTVIRIQPGSYDERVDFRSSGTTRHPIVVEPSESGVVVIKRGFRVRGDHNVIRGVAVAPGEANVASLAAEVSTATYFPWTTGQVQVTGSHNVLDGIRLHSDTSSTPTHLPGLAIVRGSRNRVAHLDLHHTGGVAIIGDRGGEPTGTGMYNEVDGGTVHHTDGMLFNIMADHTTIRAVDMHDPGQREEGGNASDGINLSGKGITVSGCAIYNIFRHSRLQHTDAIQWWNMADDLVIDGNVIGSYATHRSDEGEKYFDAGHIQFETYESDSVTGAGGISSNRVMVSNNVFLNAGEYYVINSAPAYLREGACDDWRILNNTFRCPQGIRHDLGPKARRWIISGNIFCSSGPDFGSSDWIMNHNAYTGSRSSQDGPDSLQLVKPGFVRNDVSRRAKYGIEGDWRLSSGSPLIDRADSSRAPDHDIDRRARGPMPDMGAFECLDRQTPGSARTEHP